MKTRVAAAVALCMLGLGAAGFAAAAPEGTLINAAESKAHDAALKLLAGGADAKAKDVDGTTALHWAAGQAGRGVLLVGDSLTVVMDRRYLSFMYSYPNLIPLPAHAVRRIAASVRPFAFDRIYGAWDGRNVISGGKAIERGSHAELLAADGVYRKLWDDQGHQPHEAADHVGAASDDDDDDDDDED